MAVLKVSQEVFACHSASCRPPTSGGTGGSRGGGRNLPSIAAMKKAASGGPKIGESRLTGTPSKAKGRNFGPADKKLTAGEKIIGKP